MRDDVATLIKPGGIGIELGVAEGKFSERILKKSQLAYLYSVDMYDGERCHDIDQFRRAITRLMPYRERNCLLKMRFDEALPLFEDGYFDFIYADGYAHTGEEEGQTFSDWYPKLKSGGIFAGDDYSPSWPKVVEEVDKFIARHGLKLHVIDCHEPDDWASQFPTWFTFKP